MKNNKTKLWFAALMLLAVSTAHSEPIKLDDVKVGSTVTREGISFGWGEHLPVPEGEWEVVVREEGEIKGVGPFEHHPVVKITLLNKNNLSPLQIVKIITTISFKNRQSGNITCPESNAFWMSDRMGTSEGQNFQLCKAIYKPRTYMSVFEWDSKLYTKLKRDEIDFLSKRFQNKNPVITALLLRGGSNGSFSLHYLLGVDQNKNLSEIENWLTTNMKKIEDHYDGKKITFTEMQ